MAKRYKHDDEGKDAVRRFEELLKKGEPVFFDVSEYELIIDYYVENGKYKKANRACEMASEQYPFSTEIMVQRAHLLLRKEEFDQAWDLLEKAELFQPHDPDIILLKSNILCQQDNFEESISYLEKALPLVDEKDQIYFAMGMTYEDWGKLEEAVEAF
jgi:tetratricopeptide (TPR) repeat protein